jgi:hypothetical protein
MLISARTVSILVGKGDGTFSLSPASPLSMAASPSGLAIGDFDADGVSDLAVANFNSYSMNVMLDKVTQTTTATLTAISIPGNGTHNVNATLRSISSGQAIGRSMSFWRPTPSHPCRAVWML